MRLNQQLDGPLKLAHPVKFFGQLFCVYFKQHIILCWKEGQQIKVLYSPKGDAHANVMYR